MQQIHKWTLVAASVVMTAMVTGFAPNQPPARLAAQVRFANHLTGKQSWTVMANKAAMFVNVHAGTTTAYVPVTDSVSHLTLNVFNTDSVRATTNYRFFAGSHYTITADYRNGGTLPVLSVQRDPPPGDTTP